MSPSLHLQNLNQGEKKEFRQQAYLKKVKTQLRNLVKLTKPFLWKFIHLVQNNKSQSGGEEHPFTLTVAEENNFEYTIFK